MFGRDGNSAPTPDDHVGMKRLVALTSLAALALAACGSDDGGVSIDDAWARTSAAGQTTGAVYFEITADDDDRPVAELLGVAVVDRVQVPAREVVHTRIPRHERRPPRPGRVDEDARAHAPLAVGPLEGHDEAVEGRLHARDLRRPDDLQPEMLLVAGVVVGDHVLRRRVPVGGVEAHAELVHAGQVVDPVGAPEPERLPAELPGAARTRPAIEHDELVPRIEAETTQVVGDRETGLTRADDHDRGVDLAPGHRVNVTRASPARSGGGGWRSCRLAESLFPVRI